MLLLLIASLAPALTGEPASADRAAAAPLAPPAEFLALEPATPGAPPLLYCTPNGYGVVGQEFASDANPVVRALSRAEPGSTVILEQGDYPAFSLGMGSSARDNIDIPGGQPGLPVVIDGRGRARILGRDMDAIAIDQRRPVSHITFRGLTIVTGQRTGVMFFKRDDGRNHRGFAFEDCEILGGFSHAEGRGRASKWGVWAHRLQDFRFVGTGAPGTTARIVGLRDEHAFYLQNPQGNVLIENIEASGLGRTFVQVTARRRDGPPGRGRFTVRNCRVRNIGLAPGDGYRGGTAFTVAGRHQGTLLFEGNQFRQGFNARLKELKPVGGVHGTAAFVAWGGGEVERNGTVILRDNDFQMAYGCGDRPLVSLSACKVVRLEGTNRFVSGGFQPALALDPVGGDGKLENKPNQSVQVATETVLEGPVLRRGKSLSPEQIAKLAPGVGTPGLGR